MSEFQGSFDRPRKLVLAAGLLIALALVVVVLRSGPTADAAAAFPGQGFLPDNRAWELVSPPEKGGHDVSNASWKVRVAEDGSAATYMSLGGFSDATPGNTANGAEYISVRDEDGWSTQGITPPNPSPIFPNPDGWQPGYHGELSPDLTRGVVLTLDNPTDEDPNVDDVSNLSLRDDLRTPGPGSYRLLTGCPGCGGPLQPEGVAVTSGLAYAGASDDFGHVIFESTDNLTGETTGTRPKLYEWLASTGEVRYVGVLPDSACGAPPCLSTQGSVAGNGAGSGLPGLPQSQQSLRFPHFDESMHAVSADGSRIFFTAPPFSGAAREAVKGELFVRESGAATTQINVSERTDCAGDASCGGDGIPDPAPDPLGHKPASFAGASDDGSLVYFVTGEALTDDANDGQSLYLADLDAPAGERLSMIATAGTGSAQYVVGISEDGETVYYLDDPGVGGITHGGNGTAGSLYVYHAGSSRLITDYKRSGARPPNYQYGEVSPSRELLAGENSFRVTPDGKHAVFMSALQVTNDAVGYDNSVAPGHECQLTGETHCTEVFVYDFDSDEITCASCNPSGDRPQGDARLSVYAQAGPTNATVNRNNPITNDGDSVFFSTPDPLVAGDSNGRYDVYEFDAETGEVALLSSGEGSKDSWFMDATPDGSDVFFTTRDRLAGIDADDNVDLYTARVDGGIAEQSPPQAPPPCEGDECQGEQSEQPEDSGAGSGDLEGSGNPPPGAAPTYCNGEREKANKLARKAKRLKKKARKASGKKAKRLKERAKRAKRNSRQAKRQLRNCRRAK